jgi:hypothetical protein
MSTGVPSQESDQDFQAYKSVRGAMERKGIISTNLDEEFKKAKSQAIASRIVEGQGIVAGVGGVTKWPTAGMARTGSMKRRANAGFNVDRIYDIPYNPFRNRVAVETPTNRKELNARYRYYYRYEPLVGAAVDLHSEFCLSNFQLTHEDKQLEDDFNAIAKHLNLLDFLIQMAKEYFCVGEAFPMGIFDDNEDPSNWMKFILLDPDKVVVNSHPMAMNDGPQILLNLDDSLRKIVLDGANNKQTAKIYEMIPDDVKQFARNGQPMPIESMNVSHFKRSGNPFNVRGESIISRVLHILAYRDKLRDSQYTTAERHCTPKEFYLVGSDEYPADDEELQNFANMLSSTYLDPNQAVVWHHALKIEWMGAADKALPVRQEFDALREELMAGLMIHEAMLTGEGPTFATASVGLDVAISRYYTFRNLIENWIKNAVFKPLCQIHDIYKPTKAEVDHKIKIRRDREPWVPDIKWEKYELRDNFRKIELLIRLADKNKMPWEAVYRAMNYDPNYVMDKLKKQRNMFPSRKTQPSLPGPMPLTPEAPLPGPESVVEELTGAGDVTPPEGPMGAGVELPPAGPAGVEEGGLPI